MSEQKRIPTRIPGTIATDENEGMTREDIKRIDRANQGLDGFELHELTPYELAYTKAYWKKLGIPDPT